MRIVSSASTRLVVSIVAMLALLGALLLGVPASASAAHRATVPASKSNQRVSGRRSSPADLPIGPINALGPLLSVSNLTPSVTMAMGDGTPITVTRAMTSGTAPPTVATTTVNGTTQPDGSGSSPATQFQGPDWASQLPTSAPSARSESALAYVSGSGATSDVLFGGYSSTGTVLGDTWTWNGLTWTNSSNAGPSARSGAVMAYDPSLGSGETVLYGGWNHGSTVDSDTWAWNGTVWTQLSPTTSPGPLAYSSMVWDATSNEMVLFGGSTTGSGSTTNNTWTLTGSTNATATWTQLSPATSPPVRYKAAMAYDGTANDVVLFGGRNNGTVLNDTWTFNGTTWVQQAPYASPAAMSDASMAYDAQLSGDVLFGGSNSSGVRQNTTYYWNQTSGTWEVIENNTEPSARADSVLATAAVNTNTSNKAVAGSNGQLVLVGGTTTGGTTVGDTQIFDWGHNGSNTGDATYSLPVGDQSHVAVDLGTGNLYMSNKTYNIAGTGINSSNTAGYNSQGASSLNSIVATLSALPNGSILVNELNGTYGTMIFTQSGSGFTAPAGTEATLTYCPAANSHQACVTAGTYVLTENTSQTAYTFTSTGTMQLTTITDRNGNTIQVTPTGSAPTTITDTRARTVTNAYTSGGGTQSETFTDNSINRSWVESSPTGDANYTTLTDPTGAPTQFTYNTAGQLTEIIDADTNERLFGYDANGRVDSVTQVTNTVSGTGPTTTFTWQQIPASASPNPPATAADEVVVTNPRGYSTTYVDGYGGQAVQVIDANGHYKSSTYTVDRQPMMLADALQNMTINTYVGDNLTKVSSPPSKTGATGQVSYFNYNVVPMLVNGEYLPAGYQYLPSSAVDAAGNCTAYSYDNSGNLTVVRTGLTPTGTAQKICDNGTGGHATTNAYQGDGSTSCGAKTGELCTTASPTGSMTSYGYNTNGALTSVTQPGGTMPQTGGGCGAPRLLCTSYTYDGASRTKTMTDGDGQVTTYSYDGDDRTTRVLSNGTSSCTYSSGNCVTYVYSAAGNLDTQQDSYGTITDGYDALDRLIMQKLPGTANGCAAPPMGETGIIYTYDTANNLVSYCDGGGTNTYTYDPANNLTGVATEGGTCGPGAVVQPCTAYTRDADNHVTKTVWPTATGAQQCTDYDGAGNLISLVATQGTCTAGTNGAVTHTGTAYDDLSYNYETGTSTDQPLLQAVTDNTTSITTNYSYNNYEQLTAATPTSGTGNSYGYSYGTNGNMTQQSTNGTVTLQESQMSTGALCWTTPTTDPSSCGSPPATSTTYSYDAAGNETGNTPQSGTHESLVYNPLAQTTSMTAAGATAPLTMTYTGTGSADRTSFTTSGVTTNLTDNAFGLASSTANSGTYLAYNPGSTPNTLASILIGGPSGTGNRYYYLYDGLGNVIGLINNTGGNAANYTYSPFGRTTSTGTQAANNPIRYQGGYHDATGFDKFGDRYYNPMTALWTQPDPKAPSINNPASYLLYSFDSNDPINNSDPMGANSADLAATGLIVGGAALAGAGLFLSAGVLGAGLGLVDLAGEAIGGTIGEEVVSVSAFDVAGTVAQYVGAGVSLVGAAVAGIFG